MKKKTLSKSCVTIAFTVPLAIWAIQLLTQPACSLDPLLTRHQNAIQWRFDVGPIVIHSLLLMGVHNYVAFLRLQILKSIPILPFEGSHIYGTAWPYWTVGRCHINHIWSLNSSVLFFFFPYLSGLIGIDY